jgi:hypothetical protein
MAGRILPIALASVAGVAIGVATFDGELKAQRKAKLEEDYKRYRPFILVKFHACPTNKRTVKLRLCPP